MTDLHNHSRVALPAGEAGVQRWPLLLDFLVERFEHVGHSEWLRRLSGGLVKGADGAALPAGAPFVPGSTVFYLRHMSDEAPIAAQERVVFEDELIVVADKPHFLPVVPCGRHVQHNLRTRLQTRLACPDLNPAHRLDMDTAGLVLFVKQPQHRNAYQGLFRDRAMHKLYEAIAPDLPDAAFPLERRSRLQRGEHFMQAVEVTGVVNAVTRIDKLEVQGPWARYALEPETGQRHQLRAHMNALGAAIAFDPIYPHLLPPDRYYVQREPLRLLAKSLRFTDPVSGALREFESGFALAFPATDSASFTAPL
jgi:tRNA pseudouridine32 synthase / 23S rRNA pseudouridine746 synthase